jgi:hypothetical protein
MAAGVPLPVKPKLVDAPAASAPFQDALRAVTVEPDAV